MYNNQFMLNSLNREKQKIEEMIQNYQNQPSPINNFITTNQTPHKDLIEWRILNENEEVDNLYVQNDTLFISDNLMVKKRVDGTLEKWEIKKVYPIDKKDEKINELTKKIEELERRLNDEHSKPIKATNDSIKSNGDVIEYVESKPKTDGKSIPKQNNTGTSRNDSN